MPPTQPLPPKKEVALALLERSSVYVHLDPRQATVLVPPWFKKQAQLVLQVGLNMPVPIRDLRVDDDGMSCTLSFNRAPFFCVVPWASVFAIVGCEDGRGMVWPDDVPVEVARTQAREADGAEAKEASKPLPAEAPGEGAKAKRSKKRPVLGAVPDADGDGASTAKAARPAPAVLSRRPLDPARGEARTGVSPAPAARSAAGASRKKRELPPYLRVVK